MEFFFLYSLDYIYIYYTRVWCWIFIIYTRIWMSDTPISPLVFDSHSWARESQVLPPVPPLCVFCELLCSYFGDSQVHRLCWKTAWRAYGGCCLQGFRMWFHHLRSLALSLSLSFTHSTLNLKLLFHYWSSFMVLILKGWCVSLYSSSSVSSSGYSHVAWDVIKPQWYQLIAVTSTGWRERVKQETREMLYKKFSALVSWFIY